MSAKIRPAHLSRPAVVYIRQSTLMQVLEHRESTQRQYNLAALAERLGWEPTQIQVIDEDLGKSGKSAENRSGFQRLAAEAPRLLGHRAEDAAFEQLLMAVRPGDHQGRDEMRLAFLRRDRAALGDAPRRR